MYKYIYLHNAYPSMRLIIYTDNKKNANEMLKTAGLRDSFVFLCKEKH